jgi:hypothetical protein
MSTRQRLAARAGQRNFPWLLTVIALGGACVGVVPLPGDRPTDQPEAPDEGGPDLGRPRALPDGAPPDRPALDRADAAAGDADRSPGDAAPDAGRDASGDAVLAPGPARAAVFAQDFENLATGSTWLKSCKWNKHAHVTEGCGVAGSKCLRVAHDPGRREPPLFPLPPEDERPPYPPGSGGVCFPYYTNTGTDVVQAVQPLPPAQEYSLSYDVFFEPGYDWARAGKLPGLSAVEWDSGCSIEGDGLKTDPGSARWSVRMMWRELGTTELYVYDQDRIPGACGLRSPTPMPLAVGRWIAVTIYVKVNSTAASRDGGARLYLDGVLVREDAGLRLRATESKGSLVSNIFFSTFYGGNESKRLYCKEHPDDPTYCAVKDPKIDVTWVPAVVSYADFDNIAVYPGLRVRRAPGE